MPRLDSTEIARLLAAFNPTEGRAIIVPPRRGKRGNPVLWAKRFFPEMPDIAGDVGARHLIGAYPELVAEIEMAGESVLPDIDTLAALAARLLPGAPCVALFPSNTALNHVVLRH